MIELSVALPLFNSGKIAWLALESLCKQQNINFDWELIVCEEQNISMLGEEELNKYKDRLEKIGCERIKYIPLKEWLDLGRKWRLIAENCSSSSQCFILQASDCYSQPQRLKETYDAIVKNDYDWYKQNQGLFYNIKIKKHILYSDPTNIQKGGLNMACKTQDIINKVPNEFRRAIVDGWLYKNIDPKKVYIDTKKHWQLGVDTHGLNTISIKREKFFNNIQFPFVETNLNIKTLLPDYIVNKLINLDLS